MGLGVRSGLVSFIPFPLPLQFQGAGAGDADRAGQAAGVLISRKKGVR